MINKRILCLTCKHNLRNNSCGPCVNREPILIDNKTFNLGMDLINSEDENISFLKSSCKILMKYPEDYDAIDLYNCKYYLSSSLNFY